MENTEKTVAIPEGTLNAYRKVLIERDGLSLEMEKLNQFLKNPKYVSADMVDAMERQYHYMKLYYISLNERIDIFRKEIEGIDNDVTLTKGEEIIGKFNSTANLHVEELKNRAIQLINAINVYGKSPRRNAIAITDIEKGTMMGVKSLFQ